MKNNFGRKLLSAGISVALAGSVIGLGASAASAAESNTLVFWSATASVGETNAYRVVAEAFVKAYPKYKVEFREAGLPGAYGSALTTALQAGNGPDIFKTAPGLGQLDSTVNMARAKLLMDLGTTKAKAFNPAAEASSLNNGGKVYALGLGLVVGTSLYNKTLYEKDGMGAWPTTYAALLKKCAQAKTNGRTMFTLAGAMAQNAGIMVMSMLQNTYTDKTWAAKRINGKVNFANDPGYRKTLEQVVEMNKAGCFQAGAAGAQADVFASNFFGRKSYAMFAPASLSVAWGANFPGEELRAIYFPGTTAAKTIIPASTNYALSVNAKTKAPTAAKAFINYMTGAGAALFLKTTGYIGYGKSATAAVQYEKMMPFVKTGKTYPLPNSQYTNASVYDALGKGVQGLLLGTTAPSKVLKTMDSNW